MNQVSVVYSPNVAACQLVWNHLYPKDKIPYCVRQLSLYDIWKHDDPNTLPYQEGMRVLLDKSGHGTTPYAQKMWKDALQTKPRDSKSQLPPSTWDLMRIIEGLLILKFKKGEDSKYAAAYSFEFEWAVELPVSKPVDGNETYTQIYRVIALNRGMCGSPALDPVYNPHHDLKMFFCLKPNGLYKVSLRSDREEIDCAKIAKVYGGGGHKGAAGFSIKEPFWVPRKL
jgi:oligoribonuclease NrnB/cAMP/cGMP phosphodiesterase (DHH superfamily)